MDTVEVRKSVLFLRRIHRHSFCRMGLHLLVTRYWRPLRGKTAALKDAVWQETSGGAPYCYCCGQGLSGLTKRFWRWTRFTKKA